MKKYEKLNTGKNNEYFEKYNNYQSCPAATPPYRRTIQV